MIDSAGDIPYIRPAPPTSLHSTIRYGGAACGPDGQRALRVQRGGRHSPWGTPAIWFPPLPHLSKNQVKCVLMRSDFVPSERIM